MGLVISIINTVVSLLTLLVFVYALLSYFMDQYHPVRRALGLVVEPMLAPIRKHVPPASGIDWSPLILIILLQVLGSLMVMFLRSLR